METAGQERSLRSDYMDRPRYRRLARPLPRLGEERGLVADLAPPAGRTLARKPKRTLALSYPRLRGDSKASRARALQSVSAIFSWFGL